MKDKPEYIKVSIHMVIDGEIHNMKEVKYERGRETVAYTLDSLARIVYMWERMIDCSSTYTMDGFLQEAEKKLKKTEGETAQSVFNKYWVNHKETWEKEFEKLNKGQKKDKFPIFPEENDYLAYNIFEICRHFNDNVLPVKYGFLYWLYKYVMDGKIGDIVEELENVPGYVKDIVDNKIVEKNDKTPKAT